MWIDENVKISDTSSSANYTTDDWNKAYVSLKVNVNGNLDTMNMPLSIETSETNLLPLLIPRTFVIGPS